MEDFVRKTRGVRDINSLPLDTNHELDIVSDVKGKIYIKILNRYKELLFDNGTEQWVIDMLNNLEVDVEQLKEDVLDIEQALTELPIIEDKLEAVETKLAQINTIFAQMQIDVQGLDLRTAELEREVIQLALKDQELLDKINNLDLNVDLDILYSNSTNFGNYDYSGSPNLFLNPTFSDLSSDAKINTPVQSFVTDNGESFTVDLTAVTGERMFYINNLPTLLKSTSYTYSIEAKADIDLPNGIRVRPVYIDENSIPQYVFTTIIPNMTTSYKRYSYTHTNLPLGYLKSNFHSLQFYFPADVPRTKITIKYNIKTEKGTEATPYQPNLLAEPYNMCREYPNENIADPTKTFPIKTSSHQIYIGDMEEPFTIGETYTLTIKATKPATQSFRVYNYGREQYGDMTPIEGLTDVWQLTFTVSKIHEPYPSSLTIFQQPIETVGACQIDWLKIEKGDTRTPNISYHKYVGINLKESENPNDYDWIPLAKSAETVDTRLTKTISTYDTVNALQNNRLTALETKVVDTTWQNVSVTEPFTSVTQPQVKKQNGIVYMRGTISNGTGDCFTLPEGFRPPEGAYEMQFRLPCRSASAEDYATIYVRPSGLCSIAGVNGTKPIFLSGIIFSTT